MYSISIFLIFFFFDYIYSLKTSKIQKNSCIKCMKIVLFDWSRAQYSTVQSALPGDNEGNCLANYLLDRQFYRVRRDYTQDFFFNFISTTICCIFCVIRIESNWQQCKQTNLIDCDTHVQIYCVIIVFDSIL